MYDEGFSRGVWRECLEKHFLPRPGFDGVQNYDNCRTRRLEIPNSMRTHIPLGLELGTQVIMHRFTDLYGGYQVPRNL